MDFTLAPLKISEHSGGKKIIHSGISAQQGVCSSVPSSSSLANVPPPRRRNASLTSPSLFCITCSEEWARRR